MNTFTHHVSLALPLFLLILFGYALMRLSRWPKSVSDSLTTFVFSVALPALLFRLMSNFSALPPVDGRLLFAFFGSCFLVFLFGRLLAWKAFRLDGVSQSVFALGGVFSNNVMLGLPLAKVALGDAALPSVALVLVFNTLILWTMVTVSVEWARHGSFSLAGCVKTLTAVIKHPVVIGILSGLLFGLTGLPLPEILDVPLKFVADTAAPLALIAVGMGLAGYGIREGWRISLAMTGVKLLVHPIVVWLLAWAIGLPLMETQVVVLLASIAVGTNVYLVSRQFGVLGGPVAGGLVLSTIFSALTTPLALTLTHSLAIR